MLTVNYTHKDYTAISAMDLDQPFATLSASTDGPDGAVYFSLRSDDRLGVANNLSTILADFENFIKAVLDIKE